MTPPLAPEQKLATIAHHYLEDDEYLEFHREREALRQALLPSIQEIMTDFIHHISKNWHAKRICVTLTT